jgi:hypothetical protein
MSFGQQIVGKKNNRNEKKKTRLDFSFASIK